MQHFGVIAQFCCKCLQLLIQRLALLLDAFQLIGGFKLQIEQRLLLEQFLLQLSQFWQCALLVLCRQRIKSQLQAG